MIRHRNSGKLAGCKSVDVMCQRSNALLSLSPYPLQIHADAGYPLETSTAFLNSWMYGSSNGIDLILPSVDHRVAVEIIDELHDALFELVF